MAAAAGSATRQGSLALASGATDTARGGAPRRRRRSTSRSQHPRCVFQILKRHYARYTPEMVEQVCGIPPDVVRSRSAEPVRRQLRPRAHDRVRATRSAGPSTRSACRTSAPRRSCNAARATSAGPAAASWRCAGTPSSRARPTSRRCSTAARLPADAARARHEDLDELRGRRCAERRLLGRTCATYIGQPAQGVVRRCGDRRERFLLRLPAAADRQTTAPTRP